MVYFHLGSRSDAEQEFVVLYTILDENESWYIQENVMRYTWQPYTVDYSNRDFRTSNRMHGKLAYSFIHICLFDKVRVCAYVFI